MSLETLRDGKVHQNGSVLLKAEGQKKYLLFFI